MSVKDYSPTDFDVHLPKRFKVMTGVATFEIEDELNKHKGHRLLSIIPQRAWINGGWMTRYMLILERQ